MEKLLRQFAPFVALVVAAALVVIANPADTGGSSNGEAAVAGVAATRTTTPTAADATSTAAEVPTDAAAASGAEPFASSGASSVPSSGGSSFGGGASSASSFSTPSAGGSTPTFTAPATDSSTTPTLVAPATGTPADVPSTPADVPTATPDAGAGAGSDFYLFDQVKASSVCSAGGDPAKPLELAPAFAQAVIASEPGFPDRASDLTLNRTDPEAERYVYRTHSLISNSAVSVSDSASGYASRILSQRADWERLDGIVWTPASSLIVGENIRVQERPDTAATTAKAGLAYEINPRTGVATVRPALGAKAHKGMSFDHLGNLYSVSATTPGYVYRFVPSTAGSYAAGTLSALWISPTGESMWLALPAADVAVDADAAAKAVGATALLNPGDAKTMIVTSPSGVRRTQLFVSETGAHRVLTVVLRTTTSGVTPVADNTAFTSVYVGQGVNAPKDFTAPGALMMDTTYNLYVAENNGGGGAATKTAGDDIWVAPANANSAIQASPVGRLASVTDCDATPAGLMFDLTGSKLFLNLTGRGGDGRDLTVLITTAGGV